MRPPELALVLALPVASCHPGPPGTGSESASSTSTSPTNDSELGTSTSDASTSSTATGMATATATSTGTMVTSTNGTSTSTSATTGAPTSTGSATSPGPSCGDGIVDAGEECDDAKDGDNDDQCTDKCTIPTCGDGFIQLSLGEECDHGYNNGPSDACTEVCLWQVCGDGLLSDYEECDDGNLNDLDGCTNYCAFKCDACPWILVVWGHQWLKFNGTKWSWKPHVPLSPSKVRLAITPDGMGLAVFASGQDPIPHYRVFGDGAWKEPQDFEFPVRWPLTVQGGTDGVHLVHTGVDDDLRYARYEGGAWIPDPDPIAIEGVAIGPLVNRDATTNLIYSNGSVIATTARAPPWQPAIVLGIPEGATGPQAVALTGETEILTLVGNVYYVRKAGVWATGLPVPEIPPMPDSTPSLAPLANGGVVATWWDAEKTTRVVSYDPMSSKWTVEFVFDGSDMNPWKGQQSPPQVVTGVGGADAELLFIYQLNLGNFLAHARRIDGKWTFPSFVAPGESLVSFEAVSAP